MHSDIGTALYLSHINNENDTMGCCCLFFRHIFLKINTWCSARSSSQQPPQSTHFFDDPLIGTDNNAFFGDKDGMSPCTKALDAELSDQEKMAP